MSRNEASWSRERRNEEIPRSEGGSRISSDQRGTRARLGAPRLPRSDLQNPSPLEVESLEVNAQHKWRSLAEQAIRRKEERHAPEGWKVATVSDTTLRLKLMAKPSAHLVPSEFEVTATITFEKQEKNTETTATNYSWGMANYGLVELLGTTQKPTRRPVSSREVLDRRTGEANERLRVWASDRSKALMRDPTADEAPRELVATIDELRTIGGDWADVAVTEDDLRKGLGIVATLQQLGEDAGAEKLMSRLIDRRRETTNWIRRAARERPRSHVDRRRALQDMAIGQMLGTDNDDDLPSLPTRELSKTQRLLIESRAQALAEASAPEGWTFVSAEVIVESLLDGTPSVSLVAAVTAHYREDLGVRGLPAEYSQYFWIPVEKLMVSDEATRGPIKKTRRR